MIIVLDNIRSAWNVGSIFRTVDALGASLILIGYTPQPVGRTLELVRKTAIGAENSVSWQHFEHPVEVIAEYSQTDYEHIAIEISDTSQNIYKYLEVKKEKPSSKRDYLLWFGNEIHGINSDLLAQMHSTLHLPMLGIKESLNVANTVCAVGYLFLGSWEHTV